MAVVYVTAVGDIKLVYELTIQERIRASQEIRVAPDLDIANSLGYPTIEEYITAEAAEGFKLIYLGQASIITQRQ